MEYLLSNPLNDFADEVETERTLKYDNTDYWSRFKNIVEMDEITGIKILIRQVSLILNRSILILMVI